MSLARNGKLSESMELFDIIKSKNTKIGIKPALTLLSVLIEQSQSSILRNISKEASVPLDFGYSVYRLVIDDDRVRPEQDLLISMLDLLKEYDYPKDKLCSMWIDIKICCNRDELTIDMDILNRIMQCFVDGKELKPTKEMVEWLNSTNKISDYYNKIEDDLYLQILKLCIEQNELQFGKFLFNECILKKDRNENDKIISLKCLSLECFYKSNDLETTKKIWSELKEVENKKDIEATAWNIMCKLYAETEKYEELMFLYEEMKENEIEANKEAFIAMINVCSNIVNLEKGKSVHLDMVRAQNKLRFGPNSKLLDDIEIGAALLNLYSKCGDFINSSKHWNDLKKADEDHMTINKEKIIDIKHWNCILNAHAVAGNVEEVENLYQELNKDEHINANDVTYTIIIDLMNRKGLKDKAKEIINDQNKHNENTEEDILAINTLSRSGRFEEAEKMITKENVKSSNIMWMTLLSACRRYNDIDRAKRIYQHIIEVNGGDEQAEYCQSAKLLLANIYGSIKQPVKEKQIRLELSRNRGFKKTPGMSFIEIDGVQHKFYGLLSSIFLIGCHALI